MRIKYGIGAGYNAVPFADVRRREVLSEPLGIPLSWSACGGFCFSYPKIPRWFGPSRPSIEGMVDSEYWGVPYRRMAFRQTNYEEANIPETDIEEVIRDLNIVENFEEGPIPGQMIEKVLDAGIWGPVPENLKAYRFILVKSKETKELIAKMAAEKKHESWTFNWAELQYGRLSSIPAADRVEKVEEIFASEPGRWLAEADALIIVLSGLFNWIDYPYAGLLAGPNPPLSVATGCCVQNMMIAASALGLGINYDVLVVGDERCRDILVEYLGIPAVSWMPLGILGLGKPGRKVKMPPRPPLENLFFDEYWGNPYLPEGITE